MNGKETMRDIINKYGFDTYDITRKGLVADRFGNLDFQMLENVDFMLGLDLNTYLLARCLYKLHDASTDIAYIRSDVEGEDYD